MKPAWVRRLFPRLHVQVYRLSRGRIGGRRSGLPILLLTTRGRKSGQARVSPLLYMPDGPTCVVVAANSGIDRPPAWWLNLVANPQANVRLRGRRLSVVAE
jgi:deazaflavin-dependent oxidoreductase (nitroreductase family)